MALSRGWCFTCNNYSLQDEKCFSDLGIAEGTRYLIYGRECGENGTPHLQGYLELIQRSRLSALKKIHEQAHWEPRKGSPLEAAEYCKKESNFVEFGRPLRAKVELEEACEMVRKGVSLVELDDKCPGLAVRYHRGFEAMQRRQWKDRTDPPWVVWLWGPTGVGKTREACHVPPPGGTYMKPSGKWWDGYEQQQRIVIDDFSVESIPFRELLRLLDRYPYQGEVKGGYVKINSPEIYITSEYPPEHWYSGTELAQIKRRVGLVKNLCSK